MTNVTLKDVFEVTSRIEDKLDKLECRVSVIEIWRANIMGKFAIISAVVIFSGNLMFDWIKTKFKSL
jgi:hypothetical protein